jgi:hypothetical protein
VLDTVEAQPSLKEALSRIDVPKAAAEDWPVFAKLVLQLTKAKGNAWPAEFQLVRRWYEPHLKRIYDDAEIRAADIIQLEQIAGGYPSRQRFLTELTLDPPDSTSDRAGPPVRDEDYTILSTIHSAKGQQWKIVRILSVVDGTRVWFQRQRTGYFDSRLICWSTTTGSVNANVEPRLDPDLAAMHLNDALRYGQPQAGAALLAGDGIIGLLELLKQLGLIGSGDASSGVPDRYTERAIVRFDLDGDFANIGELNGVADEINGTCVNRRASPRPGGSCGATSTWKASFLSAANGSSVLRTVWAIS